MSTTPDETGAATEAAPVETFTIRVRGRTTDEASAKRITKPSAQAAFEAAVVDAAEFPPPAEIRWDDADELACLDLDDLSGKLTPDEIIQAMSVRPWLAWVSSSGRGLHAMFHAVDGFVAKELAACAGLSIAEIEPLAGVEVLRRTAAPPNGFVILGQTDAPRVPFGWVEAADVPVDTRDEWLTNRGYRIGGRYPHDKCPFNPDSSHGQPPVVVYEDRIHCYNCGESRDFAHLISGKRPSLTIAAARNFAHWEHARHVIKHEHPRLAKRDAVAKLAYAATARILHRPDDPRVARMFNPGLRFVRLSGGWADSATFMPLTGHGKSTFNALPAIQHVEFLPDGEHDTKIDPVRGGLITSNGVIPGYPEIVPVRGISLWGIHNEYPADGRVRAVVPSGVSAPPRYVPLAHRMPEAKAWERITKSFPGVDASYLTLLIAARGLGESCRGDVPMMLVSGSTGSGKSATVILASHILGDTPKAIQPGTAPEQFDKAFGQQAASGASFIRLDEFGKTRSDERIRECFEPLYMIERLFDCTQLYVGQVTVPVTSCVIVSRIQFPQAVFQEPQIMRRFTCVDLRGTCPDWRQTSGGIAGWRDRDPRNAAAADALLSWVADKHLSAGCLPDLRRIAEEVGVISPPENADEVPSEFVPMARAVAKLFVAIRDEDCVRAQESGRRTRGWVVVRPGGEDGASRAWSEICDDAVHKWSGVRNVSAHDLSKLVGFDVGTRILTSPRNAALELRFCDGPGRGREPGRVNAEITVSPRPEVADLFGVAPVTSISGPLTAPEIEKAASVDPTPETQRETPAATHTSALLGSITLIEDDAECSAISSSTTPATTSAAPAAIASDGGPDTTSSGSTGTTDEAPVKHTHRHPVIIDLETRSGVELKRVGGRRYAEDESTTILCGCAVVDGESLVSWHHGDGLPGALPHGTLPPEVQEAVDAEVQFLAHNADGFDRPVWERIYGEVPGGWIDSLKLARAAGHKQCSLDALGQRLLGVPKDKDGLSFTLKYSIPNARGEHAMLTEPAIARIVEYCENDTTMLAQLWFGGHLGVGGASSITEASLVRLDDEINRRGIGVDLDLARGLIRCIAAVEQLARDEVEEATGGELTGGDLRKTQKLRAWLSDHGLDLPDLKAATVRSAIETGGLAFSAETDPDDPEYVGEAKPVDPSVFVVLRARERTASIVRAKSEAAIAKASLDGRVRDMFAYYAARTGRWAGLGIQPHNTPRPTHSDEEIEDGIRRILAGETITDEALLRSLLRSLFIAHPGFVFVWCDFAAIEARVLAWIADHHALVNRFRNSEPIYETAAASLFGKAVEDVTKSERGIGKVQILACGYQLGADGAAKYYAASGIDLEAIGLTPAKVVKAYRKDNAPIADLWRTLRDVAFRVIRGGAPETAGRCQWSMNGDTLVATLPSGRSLFYRNARIEKHVPVYKLKPDWDGDLEPVDTVVFDEGDTTLFTYGGKLTENITQAIARDLLADAMLRTDALGLSIVLHVHDEEMVEVPEHAASEVASVLERVMSTPPEWAKSLPLKAEAQHGSRYGK